VKTAALIVIGDEILTGKVKDENSFAFANTMFNRGVSVPRIEVIPDDIDTIAESVKKFADRYNYVCTSGGVGPTHDDKTYEGIARAFNLSLLEHAQVKEHFLQAQMRANKGNEILPAQKKMLTLPATCEVYFLEPMWMPIVRVKNVYIFPGVPLLFEKYMNGLAHLFDGGQFFREIIFTNQSEVAIAENLSRVQDKFSMVAIGSYPQMPKGTYQVMVSIEGSSKEMVAKATNELLTLIHGRYDP